MKWRISHRPEIQRPPLVDDNLVKSSESNSELPDLTNCLYPSVAMTDSEWLTIKSTQAVFSSVDWCWSARSRMATAESMVRLEMM